MRARQPTTGPGAARDHARRAPRASSESSIGGATTSPTSAAQSSSSEWERFLAPFRPEARALFNLMVEVQCRLAGEAYRAYLANQADHLQQRKQRKQPKQQEGQR